MDLLKTLCNAFNYTRQHAEQLIAKSNGELLEKAIKDAMRFKPGDRRYLQEKYKLLKNPPKPLPIRELTNERTVSVETIAKVTKEVQAISSKHLS